MIQHVTQLAISELPFASVSKGFVPSYSSENDFDLHKNGREGGANFYMNGFARDSV